MYRILCNSLKNYAKELDGGTRHAPVKFLHLVTDTQKYATHKAQNTDEYRRLSHFLWEISDCPSSEQTLYELSVLGIEGKPFLENPDFTEARRIWNMLMKKAYWRDCED